MKTCPNCSSKNTPDSLYCQECGYKLPEKHKTVEHHAESKQDNKSISTSIYQKLKDTDLDDVIFKSKKERSHTFRNIVIIICIFFLLIFILIALDSSNSDNSSPNSSATDQTNSDQYFSNSELSFLRLSDESMYGNDGYSINPRYEATLHNYGSIVASNIIGRVNFYKNKEDTVAQDTRYVVLSDYLGPGDSTFINFYIETPYNTSGDFYWKSEIYSAEKY